jgi:hypothetical protein
MVSRRKHICLNCIRWEGDRTSQYKEIQDNPNCMDAKEGWPLNGTCPKIIDFVEVASDVYGEIKTNSNYGCIYFEHIV